MDHASELILIGAALVFLSILAGVFSQRIGAPLLLTFLGVGVFFGEDGPGGIVFNDKHLSFVICSLGLAIILFDGGMRTSYRSFVRILRPALLLSTAGVVITAIVTGAFAAWLMGIPLLHGLLFGSIVASTDPAAVFLLLNRGGGKIKDRLRDMLEVESGINDPMAIFLTVTCVSLLQLPAGASTDIFAHFLQQALLGVAMGYAGGKALALLTTRLKLESGLSPIFAMAGGLCVFSATHFLGGSGFLAVYLCGMVIGNSRHVHLGMIKDFHDGVAWLSQLGMMLILGLLVTPSQLPTQLFHAVGIALVLIFIARPLAVWFCLTGSRFSWREKSFIAWVGLRGVVPIYLALIPALMGLDGSRQYFNIAFIIVLVSLILQGWTIRFSTKFLGLQNEAVGNSA